MNQRFDLVDESWIPCIGMDGRPVSAGLRAALLQAHELREMHGESPLVTASLHRLLLAILHCVFGPAGTREWVELWQAGRWDPAAVDAYLSQWHHRFDLFDADWPFYQAPDGRVKPKSVGSLIHAVASGNNPTLFDHHTDGGGITLSPAQAARMVVAGQSFGLGGLSGLQQKFTDGPCAGGIVFLVQGKNLFETLALNLLRYEDASPLPRQPDDRPCWEMDDPFTPDRAQPRGYLDYLTWQNRRVLFFPEEVPGGIIVREMTMAPALRLDDGILDPMSHYRLDKQQGPRPLAFTEGRALWRDSAALFRLHDVGVRPAQTFLWLAELVEAGILTRSQTRRYLALGMSKKQAKVFFFRSEQMPLPLEYLENRVLVDSLETMLHMAEETAKQLWGATRTLATLILSPEADVEGGRQPAREDLDQMMHQWALERRYWVDLERPYKVAMEALPEAPDDTLKEWRKLLTKTAWGTLDGLTAGLGSDAHLLKAMVRARDQLAAGLAKVLPAIT